MKFKAEIKQIKAQKSVSLDIVYTVQLITDDPSVLELGALSADQIVNVEVTND